MTPHTVGEEKASLTVGATPWVFALDVASQPVYWWTRGGRVCLSARGAGWGFASSRGRENGWETAFVLKLLCHPLVAAPWQEGASEGGHRPLARSHTHQVERFAFLHAQVAPRGIQSQGKCH